MEESSPPNLLFFASRDLRDQTGTQPHVPSALLLQKIRNENMLDQFRIIDIIDLINQGRKIPVDEVPSIIAPKFMKPLTGEAAHEWIQNKKYLNQKTNNHTNKIYNPLINEDTSMHNESTKTNKTDDYACIKDSDDDKRSKMKYNGAEENKKLTNLDDIHKQIKEYRVSSENQSHELNKLILMRKEQMTKYMKKK